MNTLKATLDAHTAASAPNNPWIALIGKTILKVEVVTSVYTITTYTAAVAGGVGGGKDSSTKITCTDGTVVTL